MSTTPNVSPSTLSGIRRKAKSIGHSQNIPHFAALDLSAKQSGYESYQHARKALQAGVKSSLRHSIFLSSYWRDTSTKPWKAGLEVLEIKLPRQLKSFFGKHQCQFAQCLQGFFVEYSDHLEMRGNAESQARARELLTRAGLSLQFMEATGLLPATTKLQRRTMDKASELPSADHVSRWLCANTGSWLMLDEPYGHVAKPEIHDERSAWVAENALNWAKPEWEGLYYPGQALPYMVTKDAQLLSRVVGVVEHLQSQSMDSLLVFQSESFYIQFVSPARSLEGKKRKPRPGTTYGFSKNAVEYQRREGFASIWRPAQRMSVEHHKEMGLLLKRLYHSNTPFAAHVRLKELQSELENWMFAEYRGENRSDVDLDVYYGGADIPPYSGRAELLSAIDRVRSIMLGTYLDSKPLRDYLKKLDLAQRLIAEE